MTDGDLEAPPAGVAVIESTVPSNVTAYVIPTMAKRLSAYCLVRRGP